MVKSSGLILQLSEWKSLRVVERVLRVLEIPLPVRNSA